MGKTLELAQVASELLGCYVAISCRSAPPWVQAADTLLQKCLPHLAIEAPAHSHPLCTSRQPCLDEQRIVWGARFAATAS